MGTIAITTSVFAALPPTAPPNWPSNLVWPPTGTLNGTTDYTISDADVTQMLAWIATNYNAQLTSGETGQPPYTLPATAILRAWLNGFMQASTESTQRHHTTPAQPPPPITIS